MCVFVYICVDLPPDLAAVGWGVYVCVCVCVCVWEGSPCVGEPGAVCEGEGGGVKVVGVEEGGEGGGEEVGGAGAGCVCVCVCV